MKDNKWHELTAEQIANYFGSDISRGLSVSAAAQRLSQDGESRIYPENREKYAANIKHILTDLTVVLLVFTAVISAAFGQSVSIPVIISLIVLNLAVCVAAYLKAHSILKETGKRAEHSVKVVRDGHVMLISSSQTVCGDVIFLSAGDTVPADARIIQSEELTVLQTDVTGEKKPVRKRSGFAEGRSIGTAPEQQTNMLFASSVVMSGSGRAIICATSENTCIRKLGRASGDDLSYEKLRLFRFMRSYSSAWGLCMLAAVFIIAVIDLIFGSTDRSLFDSFITALTLAVASMSSCYLAFTYIVVSSGVLGLGKRGRGNSSGALVKNIGKLGSAKDITALIVPYRSLIASDSVKLERVYAAGVDKGVSDHGFKRNCIQLLRLAVISTGLYGGSRLVHNNLNGKNIYSDDEELIISYATNLGIYNLRLDRDFPMADHVSAGNRSRFDTTLYLNGGDFRAVSRGDAERILASCSHFRDYSGVVRMNSEKRDELRRYVTAAAKNSCRVIALASKKTQYTNLRRIVANQSDLIFEGFLVISEPLIEGAARNIVACREAGIRVIMTCDGRSETGVMTAKSLGIVSDDSRIVSGEQISGMKPDIFRINIPLYDLYIGLSSSQLETLVSFMKADGAVVGIAADRLGQLSAMRDGDVGFALQSGAASPHGGSVRVPIVTNVSIEHSCPADAALMFYSDVVLCSPDIRGSGGFNGMVGTVKSSVQIYRNVLRVSSYLLTVQIARLAIVLWSVISGYFVLTPVQVLFSGLIIDFAAVFTIAFQPPSTHVLKYRHDVDKKLKRPFFSNIRYVVFGILWAAVLVLFPYILNAAGLVFADGELVSSSFLGFMITQFFVMSEIKREHSIFDPNIRFSAVSVLIVLLCVAFAVISVFIPAFGTLFGIKSVGSAGIAAMLIPPAFMLIVLEIDKIIRGYSRISKYIGKIISKFTSKSRPAIEPDAAGIGGSEKSEVPVRTGFDSNLFEGFDFDEFIASSIGLSDGQNNNITSDSVEDSLTSDSTDSAAGTDNGGGTATGENIISGDIESSASEAVSPVDESKSSEIKSYSDEEVFDVSDDNTDSVEYEIGNDIIESIFSVHKDDE